MQAIKHWPLQEQPRYKLLNHGAQSLSDAELLAIFLRTGIKGKTAIDLSRDILQRFGGIRPLLDNSWKEIQAVKGLGAVKYAQLKACPELSRRYFQETLQRQCITQHPHTLQRYLTEQLRAHGQEVFACLFLDSQHRLIAFKKLFYGTLHTTYVHPREILKQSLNYNAAALILAHNHPSGDPKPSKADIEVTQRIKRALELLDIPILDHLIVGDNEVFSFYDGGLL